MQSDADAGFETEDGLEDDVAALDCHGEECKLAAVTTITLVSLFSLCFLGHVYGQDRTDEDEDEDVYVYAK